MITLYSTGCPKCRILKQKLDTVGVKYEVNNSVDEMIAMGFTHAPILDVDGQIMDFATANEWVNNYGENNA